MSEKKRKRRRPDRPDLHQHHKHIKKLQKEVASLIKISQTLQNKITALVEVNKEQEKLNKYFIKLVEGVRKVFKNR